MAAFVPLLAGEQVERLPERAREVVEYRKSSLSLNHIQGCPLNCVDCAYCIRQTYGLWDQRQPRALMSDADAVNALVGHRYFQPHVTPVQVFNRAADPFLPNVRPHTFAVLEDLDERGLTNHVLVITRHQMQPEDAVRLNELRHVKVTLLFTYSSIDNKQIEPYPSHASAESLKLMSAPPRRKYRTCAVSYAHGLPDYNGHYGIRKLCDICSLSQVELCAGGHWVPSPDRLHQFAEALPEARGLEVVEITNQAAVVSGLDTKQPRYYLQHALGFQVHDVVHPHRQRRHGRAEIGWKDTTNND